MINDLASRTFYLVQPRTSKHRFFLNSTWSFRRRPCSKLPHRIRAFSLSLPSQVTSVAHPPAHRSLLLRYPSRALAENAQDVDENQADVELVPPKDAQIHITHRAAEVSTDFKLILDVSTFTLYIREEIALNRRS